MNTDKMEVTAQEDTEWNLKEAELNNAAPFTTKPKALTARPLTLREEHDMYKERCSDLELQLDKVVYAEKGHYESFKRIAKLFGKRFAIDIGYENLPDEIESQLKQKEWPQNGDEVEILGLDAGQTRIATGTYIGVSNCSFHVVIAVEQDDGGTILNHIHCGSIRKPETPEQKAARERDEAIEEIESTLRDRIHFNNSFLPTTIASCLFDNGYRKQD